MKLRTVLAGTVLGAVLLGTGITAHVVSLQRVVQRMTAADEAALGILIMVHEMDQLGHEYLYVTNPRVVEQWELLSQRLGGLLEKLPAAGAPPDQIDAMRIDLAQARRLFQRIVAETLDTSAQAAHAGLRRSRLTEQLLVRGRELARRAAAIHRSNQDRQEAIIHRAVKIDSLLGVLLVGGIAVASWLLRQRLLRPVEALRRSTETVARGSLEVRIPAIGNDELADLGRAFNIMVEELRLSRQRLVEEERLRGRERALREITDALPQLVWTVQGDGSVREYNVRTRALLLSAEAADWHSLLHPADQAGALLRWRAGLATWRPFEDEWRLATPAGWRWHLIHVQPLGGEGGSVRWVVSATDIDDRRRVEDDLRQSRNQAEALNSIGVELAGELDLARLAQRAVSTAVLLTGAQYGTFLHLVQDEQEQRVQRRVSAGLAEAFPQLAELSRLKVPADAPPVLCWDRVGDRTADEREAWGIPPGTRADASLLLLPLRTRGGQRHGVLICARTAAHPFTGVQERLALGIANLVGVAFDNARLYAGERRNHRNAAARSAELARTNAELERFAYICSHDLQEPLRMVANWLGLLEHRYAGQLDEKARGFIGHAVKASQRMQGMVRDLLAYSRGGHLTAEPEPCALADCVRDATANLVGAIEQSGARIAVAELPTVRYHRVMLVQLFQNLLGNALKYRGEAVPEIAVRAAREPDGWRVEVQDNGIGIDAAQHARIFELFHRLHGQSRYEGFGIGLSLCKKIVEGHGGRIGVASQPGDGACFWFTIPDQLPDDSEGNQTGGYVALPG